MVARYLNVDERLVKSLEERHFYSIKKKRRTVKKPNTEQEAALISETGLREMAGLSIKERTPRANNLCPSNLLKPHHVRQLFKTHGIK